MTRRPIASTARKTGTPTARAARTALPGGTTAQSDAVAPEAISQTHAVSLTRPPPSRHASSAMNAQAARPAKSAQSTATDRLQAQGVKTRRP